MILEYSGFGSPMILESSGMAVVHTPYFPVMSETWRWGGGDLNFCVGMSFQGCYLGCSELGVGFATETATPGD